MNGWIATVLIVVALGLYSALCALCVVYVSIPGSLLAAHVGAVAGMLFGVGCAVLVLTGRHPAPVCTPADAVANRLGERPPPVPGPGDAAWPQYFARQASQDFQETVSWAAAMSGWLWRESWRRLPRDGAPALAAVLGWPVLMPVLAGLVGFSAGLLVALLVVTSVFTTVIGVAWAVALLVTGAVRVTDRWWQHRRSAVASCVHCYHVTPLPAYRCPGAHAGDGAEGIHRDLRAGLRGVWWRRCVCGTRLPTGVLRAARRLQPLCPMCLEPLPTGAAVVTDVRIPMFGTSGAGKTQFALAALFALVQEAEQRAVLVKAENPASAEHLQQARALVDTGRAPGPTDPRGRPAVTSVRLGSETQGPLVHIFDASGEALADAVRHETFAFFDFARTLVFVVDPLRLPAVSLRLGAGPATAVPQLPRAAGDPEDAYHATVNRLRLFGVDTRHQRLAVVITKVDLLRKLRADERPLADSTSVRKWLCDHGLDNVVLAAERDFAAVRFFGCSATGENPQAALPPLRWLLASERIYPRSEAGVGR